MQFCKTKYLNRNDKFLEIDVDTELLKPFWKSVRQDTLAEPLNLFI